MPNFQNIVAQIFCEFFHFFLGSGPTEDNTDHWYKILHGVIENQWILRAFRKVNFFNFRPHVLQTFIKFIVRHGFKFYPDKRSVLAGNRGDIVDAFDIPHFFFNFVCDEFLGIFWRKSWRAGPDKDPRKGDIRRQFSRQSKK